MNGLALTILIGQLPKLFGFSADAERPDRRGARVRPRPGRRARRSARRSAIGLLSLALILALGRWLPRVPGVLVAVVVAIAAASVLRPGRPRRLASRRRCRRDSRRSPSPTRSSDLPAAGRRSARDRAGRAHRHDLDRVGVRRPHRPGGRRQRGDDRDRRRERRRGLLPGIPGQHQRLAHRGRRAGRRQDAGHGRGRRRADRADAGARARAAARTCRTRRSPRS